MWELSWVVLEWSWGALGAVFAAIEAILRDSWGGLGGSGLGSYSFVTVWATQDGSDPQTFHGSDGGFGGAGGGLTGGGNQAAWL